MQPISHSTTPHHTALRPELTILTMADEDKEKAEKLAAAKKRFEQLKKEQKKGKKGGKKKADKDAKAKDAEAEAEEAPEEEATKDEAVAEMSKEDGEAEDDKPAQGEEDSEKRAPSESQRSKQRSESFKRDTEETYKKQAAKIEQLESENKTLSELKAENAARTSKMEEELEKLREGSSELASLRTKAKEADRLTTELASVQRQLSQAQQASKGPNRRQSGTTPDLQEKLNSQTSTIESLELDISNLRNQISTLESSLSERETSSKDLEERAKTAEASTESVQKELDALKFSIAFPSDETKAASEDPEALTKRITVLESDLRTANSNLEAAAKRAESLENKIEALTKLHKETTATKDKEITDLRAQAKKQSQRPSHVKDASEFELGEEETETGQLHAKIRALEAENFDLRRGIWRDRRAELQPGMGDPDSALEDVDLNNNNQNGPYPSGRTGSLPHRSQQHSTFQDVITSGINAFTGGQRSSQARDRAESLGLLDDDDDGGSFDAEAFRLAQEEDQKRRIERIREVKRGLDEWKGWKVDIADLRRTGVPGKEVGPVFEL